MIVTGKGWPKIFINPIVQPKARFFYWPSTVHPAGGQAVWMLAVKTLIDASGIHIVGIGLGRYDINTGRQLSFRDIPGLNGKIGYGSEIFDYGGYTYLYGWLGAKTTTYMYVARVPAGRLDARWSYYTGTSWSPSPAAARPVLSGGGGPGLLNLGNLGLVAVSQDIMLGRTIWAWRAQTPYGPFTAKHAVGTIPTTARERSAISRTRIRSTRRARRRCSVSRRTRSRKWTRGRSRRCTGHGSSRSPTQPSLGRR